ncbi:hypothetical protein HMPREF1982_01707 [Clostridiales bacterium oral taxon 876 str. F0540]|nr:hypothetical protein HMPREF1982_01707 [Clostridiales bacterium oral taxon 876 str. F0540]
MSSEGVNIIYKFIRKGEVVSSQSNDENLRPQKNRIFLDVGNDLSKGIIDQHQGIDGIYINGRQYQNVSGILCACPYLLLENIDEDAKEVEVVMHTEPDFDCFASAYIARELIQNRRLPENYEDLCEYAEAVDSGKMKIENGNVRTLYAVAYAIEEIIREENKNIRRSELDSMCLIRGIQLIEYAMSRLSRLSIGVKSLYNPSIILSDGIFKKEIELLNEDYKRYEKDIDSICKKKIVRLPVKDKAGMLKSVDALFWKKEPSCILHKYWARSDKNSPTGTGYIFTFIPWEPCRLDVDKQKMFSELKIDINRSNRVILSVDPNSDVYLKNLGQLLEKYECIKEKELKIEGKWRDRGILRYQESWCTNNDPWFDGRSFNYTIVDAPRAGSLLSIDEIENVFIEYTKTKVERSINRFVIPFNYDHTKYKKLVNELSKSGIVNRRSFSKERTDYFLGFIKDYLYGKKAKSYTKEDCSPAVHFELKTEQVFLNADKFYLSLFKYGTGVLYFDVEKAGGEEISFEELLKFNKSVSNIFRSETDKIENTLKKHIKDEFVKSLNIEQKELMIWSIMELDRKTVYKHELQEMSYKLSNFMEWDEFNKPDEKIYNIENFASLGFSTNGGAIILVDNDDLDGRVKNKIEQIYNEFQDKYFDIFLLSLQKRNTMIYFAQKLASFKSNRSPAKISKLRTVLLDFMAQGWFSQITNNKFGAEIYQRWEEIFNCSTLYNEVVEQLEIIDDFYNAKNNNKFQFISSIFFPAVTLASIYGVGIIKLETLYTIKEGPNLRQGWIIFGLIGLLACLIMYLGWKFKDRD